MEIRDSFIDAALSLPDERDGDELMGAIARYLRTGEAPQGLRAVPNAVWTALCSEVSRSRSHILAGRSGGSSNGMPDGSRERIPARTRFRVLERDGFTCQYCGAKAPNVELHVDHIVPVAKGGTNDESNLVTACAVCNLGKGTLGTMRFSDECDG